MPGAMSNDYARQRSSWSRYNEASIISYGASKMDTKKVGCDILFVVSWNDIFV